MSSLGGHGHSSYGGGSGGRIAIHTDNNEYRGTLRAYGQGGSSSGDKGGPGTVFVEDSLGLEYQRRLYLDGNDLEIPKPVVIWERNPTVVDANETLPNDADIHFDHVMLNRKVRETIAQL